MAATPDQQDWLHYLKSRLIISIGGSFISRLHPIWSPGAEVKGQAKHQHAKGDEQRICIQDSIKSEHIWQRRFDVT